MNKRINKVIKLMKKAGYLKSQEEEKIYRIIMLSYYNSYKNKYNREPSIEWLLAQKYPTIVLSAEVE